MAKALFGQVELDVDAYRDFLSKDTSLFLGEEKIPVSSFSSLFHQSEKELENLLKQVPAPASPAIITPCEEILNEYLLIGHGKSRLNESGLITGWSNDLLSDYGEMKAVEQSNRISLNDFYLRFVSDLPRAMQHALILAKSKEREELCSSFNVAQKRHAEIVQAVLRQGFIPTPFLRAQYYGPLEHYPERLTEEELESFFERENRLVIESGFYGPHREDWVRKEHEKLADGLRHRKELLFSFKGDYGKLTETRLDLVERVSKFYEIVNRFSKGKRVLVVTSSGCFDASSAYFRNYVNRGKLTIENEPKQRGRELKVKLGRFHGQFCYLNDPEKIEKLKESSAGIAKRQREASLDAGIRSGEDSVIPVELIGFEKEENGKYESHKISLEDILKSDVPTLILGNFGQGKSTAAVEITEKLIAEKLNPDGKYKGRYVPVFLTARDINNGLLNKLRGADSEKDSEIMNLLSQKVPSFPQSLREDYKFVFLIDALDEIHNIKTDVLRVARDKLKDYGKVIVTSRFVDFNEHENGGFTTLQMDPQSVIRNLDLYLVSRITDASGKTDWDRFSAFKEFLARQDDSVKSNYLLVHFLTNLYKNEPERLAGGGTLTEEKILLDGLQFALWDHNSAKRSDMHCKNKDRSLSSWIGFLQRAAACTYLNEYSAISHEGLEEVLNGWTIAERLSKRKAKSSESNSVGFDHILNSVEAVLQGNGSFHFTHPSFREVLAARQFADEINSGKLDVKHAASALWIYDHYGDLMAAQEESASWDDLPHRCYFETDGLRSEWKPVLARMAGMLNPGKAREFVDAVGAFHKKAIKRLNSGSIMSLDEDPAREDLEFVTNFIAQCDTSDSPGGYCKEILDTFLKIFFDYSNATSDSARGLNARQSIDALVNSNSRYVLKSLANYVVRCGDVANFTEYANDKQFAALDMAYKAIFKLEKSGSTLDELLAGEKAIGYNGDYRHLHGLMSNFGGMKCLNSLITGIREYRTCAGQEDVNSHFRANKISYFKAIFSLIMKFKFDPELIKQFNHELSKWKDDKRLMKVYGTALKEFARIFDESPGLELYDRLEKNKMQFWDYWKVYKKVN